jgi:hypothetical protein
MGEPNDSNDSNDLMTAGRRPSSKQCSVFAPFFVTIRTHPANKQLVQQPPGARPSASVTCVAQQPQPVNTCSWLPAAALGPFTRWCCIMEIIHVDIELLALGPASGSHTQPLGALSCRSQHRLTSNRASAPNPASQHIHCYTCDTPRPAGQPALPTGQCAGQRTL